MTATNRNAEVAHLDDEFFIVAPFVNYEPVESSSLARITGGGSQPLGGTRLMREQGVKILALSLSDDVEAATSTSAVADAVQRAMTEKYLDLSGEEPALKARPIIDWGFDKPEVLTREEATLAKVPACLVSFSGPVAGTQAHETDGDLVIGFATPGAYTITLEAFPYRTATFDLVVKPRTSTQVDLGVKL